MALSRGARIDKYETELAARDSQFEKLLVWARKVSKKTGIPLDNLWFFVILIIHWVCEASEAEGQIRLSTNTTPVSLRYRTKHSGLFADLGFELLSPPICLNSHFPAEFLFCFRKKERGLSSNRYVLSVGVDPFCLRFLLLRKNRSSCGTKTTLCLIPLKRHI